MIRLDGITRTYRLGTARRFTRWSTSMSEIIATGEHVAIMGPFGSGKSTLLNTLGCLDRPTSGSYFLDDRDVSKLSATPN